MNYQGPHHSQVTDDGTRYHVTGIGRCVIGGFHGRNTLAHQMTQCDLCGRPVCVEHKGLHWERAHSDRS